MVAPLTLAMPDNVKLVSCEVLDQSKDFESFISVTPQEICPSFIG